MTTDERQAGSDGETALVRRVSRIGAVITTVVIVVGLLSVVVPKFHVCSEQLAQTGTSGVVTVCQPVISEVALLGLVLLLIALLLLPVLSKFDVAGLLSIELKAERAQKEAEDAKKLAETVQKQSDELGAVQRELREVQEQLVARSVASSSDAEWAALIRNVQVATQPSNQASGPPDDLGDLFQRLMSLWDELQPYTLMGRSGYTRSGPERVVAVTEAGRTSVLDWRRKFRLEIEQVRAVRNQVAHGRPVDTEELSRVVQLADILLRAVRASVNRVE